MLISSHSYRTCVSVFWTLTLIKGNDISSGHEFARQCVHAFRCMSTCVGAQVQARGPHHLPSCIASCLVSFLFLNCSVHLLFLRKACSTVHMWGQKAACRNLFSPFTTCVLRLKPKSSGLVAITLALWALSQALSTSLFFSWEAGSLYWLSKTCWPMNVKEFYAFIPQDVHHFFLWLLDLGIPSWKMCLFFTYCWIFVPT